MKRLLLNILIISTLFIGQLPVFSQAVNLSVKKRIENGSLIDFKEGSEVIVFSKKGTLREGAELPLSAFEHSKTFPTDKIGENGKTLNQYRKTEDSDEILFVYVKTAENEIYYSSDGNGGPEYKQIIAGLIHTEKLTEKTKEVIPFFQDSVSMSLNLLKRQEQLVDDTKLLILTKDKARVERRGYPMPSDYIRSMDTYEQGFSKKKYGKSKTSGLKYFVYALTPNGDLFYSTNKTGQPSFDLLIKGEMKVEKLSNEEVHKKVLPFFNDSDLRYQITSKTNAPTGIWIIFLAVSLVLFIGYFARRALNEQFVNFIMLGFIVSLIMGFVMGGSDFSQVQFPIAFSMISLSLGVYLATVSKAKYSDKFLLVYTYFILGFAYSFFFYFVINKVGLKGDSIDLFNELVSILLIAIAVGAFVYLFTVSFLFLGRKDSVVKIASYLSISFFPVIVFSLITDFDGQANVLLTVMTVFIHYLFVATVVVFLIGMIRTASLNDYTKGVKTMLTFLAVGLNYFVIPAILSIVIYALNETFLVSSSPVRTRSQRFALIFSLATFGFHFLFLFSYNSMLDFLSVVLFDYNSRLASSLIWGVASLLIITPIGYTVFAPIKAYAKT